MADAALRTLHHRSEQLRNKMRSGTQTEVKAAREMLRLSLVDLYELGHWQSQPNDLQIHMRLYRAAETKLTAPGSNSVPDRMDRYSL
jgi:hypothetical protein